MDLSDPTRAVTPTLDGTVLAVLAAAGKPLTVGDVARQAARGSEIGIRRSLARLVEQGIVRATVMGRNQVHELNRDHIAADAAVLLSGLRNELWGRFRAEFATWRPKPVYACVFGSAARGDGDTASDIDLLLIQPSFDYHDDALGSWEQQIDRLRDLAERWTGNPLQIVQLTVAEWRRRGKAHRQLVDEIRRDAIELVAPGGS
jgi:predicted nucleotidyltransferase